MSIKQIVATLTLALSQVGCAGLVTAVTDQSITSDHFIKTRDYNKLKTVSGDRRLVRVQAEKYTRDATDKAKIGEPIDKNTSLNGNEYLRWIVCAETQADAVAGRSADSSLKINSGEEGSDKYTNLPVKTFDRTEVADVVRQLSWQLCNARLNGFIDNNEYKAQLIDLQLKAFQAVTTNHTTANAKK